MHDSLPLVLLTVLFALMSGCTDDPPEQLEALEITSSSSDESIRLNGSLAVEGSGRDFTLILTEGEQMHEIRIHSSGESDLSLLDGRTVEVTWRADTWTSVLVVSDDDGPLYIADGGAGADFVAELLGRSLVERGETLAETREGDHRVQYTALEFASDGGTVSVVPGEVAMLTMDGASWRAAAVAGWRARRVSGATARCASMLASMSYELLRIETAAEPRSLARASDLDIARHGCAWSEG